MILILICYNVCFGNGVEIIPWFPIYAPPMPLNILFKFYKAPSISHNLTQYIILTHNTSSSPTIHHPHPWACPTLSMSLFSRAPGPHCTFTAFSLGLLHVWCVTLVWAAAKMSAAFEKPAWHLQKPSGQPLRPRLAPYQVGWGSTKIQVGRLQAKLPITGSNRSSWLSVFTYFLIFFMILLSR
jgi:hypothetical protein